MYKKLDLNLSVGLYDFHQSKLKTRFCFAYDEVMDCRLGTNTCQDALNSARNVKLEWFIDENIKDDKRILEHLKEWESDPENSDIVPMFRKAYFDQIDVFALEFKRKVWIIQEMGGSAYTADIIAKGINKDDCQKLIAFYESIIQNTIKRCNTYWKRYGASKLDTWTYSSND